MDFAVRFGRVIQGAGDALKWSTELAAQIPALPAGPPCRTAVAFTQAYPSLRP